MNTDLHLLLLEDRETDAELILREVSRTGLRFAARRVIDEAEFSAGLRDPALGLILADHDLPSYDGLSALALARKERPDVPFIFVTGTLGEEKAVDCIRRGATDYVIKQRLARLGSAIQRALAEVAERERRRRAEDALRVAHGQLQHLLAHSPAVLYTLELLDDVITPLVVSDNIERLLGVPAAEASGYQWWLESLHPEDRERVLTTVRSAFARDGQANGYSMEYRMRHRNGSFRWIEDENRILRDGTGEPTQAVGVWTDVTVRKELEAEVLLQQHRLTSFFTGATAGMVVMDQELRYLQINDALAEMNGLPVEEHIGRTLREVLPELARSIEPHLRQVLATGEPVRNLEIVGETGGDPVRRRHFMESYFPIAGANGGRVGVGALVVEITELKQAEAALRDSEKRFRSLVTAMEDSVFILDRQQRLVGAYGSLVRQTEHVGRTMRDVYGAEAAVVHEEAEQRALDGESVMYEWSVDEPEGRRHFQTRLSPMRGDGEEITGLVGVGRELTELKKMQAGLLVSDRMVSVGMLAAGVAHEINNPLAVVTANLSVASQQLAALTRATEPSPQMSEFGETLADAREAAERVRLIVRDMKIFSRSERVEQQSMIVLQRVLDSTLRMASNEIRHRARLVKDYGPVPMVRGNESRLGQVLLNLVVNAAQAIPEGRAAQNEVRVATRTGHDGRAIIEIADTGTGMSREVLDKLFTPFFTTKPVGVGTGLGLSICHRIVHEAGGEISVESQVGRGSTFRVLLPAAPDEADVEVGDRTAAQAATRRGSILVVDDESGVGKAVRRILGGEHDVVAVTRAADALSLVLGEAHFDVILCDLMMPQMTGMDLHAEMAKLAPEQAAIMVFVTGGAFTQRARSFLDEVTNHRIEKPFDVQHLRAIVNGLVN
jgi:PAS domain S-box-containing protein